MAIYGWLPWESKSIEKFKLEKSGNEFFDFWEAAEQLIYHDIPIDYIHPITEKTCETPHLPRGRGCSQPTARSMRKRPDLG